MSKLIETQACYFCEITTETIQHLFWYCPVVKNFIFGIFEKLEVSQEELKDIGPVEFLLGGMNGHNKTSLNCLFTLIQKYTFVTKARSSVLCFNSFIRFIKYHYDMENGIAFYKLGNIEKHLKKCSYLKTYCK